MTPIAAIALPALGDPGIAVPAPGPPFKNLLAAATLAVPLTEELPALAPTTAPANAAAGDVPVDPTPEELLLSTAALVVPVRMQIPNASAAPPAEEPATKLQASDYNILSDDPETEDEPVAFALAAPVIIRPILALIDPSKPPVRSTLGTAPIDAPGIQILRSSATLLAQPTTPAAPASLKLDARPATAAPTPTVSQLDPANSQPTLDDPLPTREVAPTPASQPTPPNPQILAAPPTPPAIILPPAVPQIPMALAASKPLEARVDPLAPPARRRDSTALQAIAPPLASFSPDRAPAAAEPRLVPTSDAPSPASVDATVRNHAANAIELATDRLGAVRLAFDASDTAVRVHVTTDRPATASLIVAQADRLQAAVETGGTRLAGLSVDVRDGGDHRRQLPWQQSGQDHPAPQLRRVNRSETTQPNRQDRYA